MMWGKKKEKRFNEELIQSSEQGGLINIWVDSKTGVHYLYVWSAQGSGLTPLLNEKGEVVVEKPTSY